MRFSRQVENGRTSYVTLKRRNCLRMRQLRKRIRANIGVNVLRQIDLYLFSFWSKNILGSEDFEYKIYNVSVFRIHYCEFSECFSEKWTNSNWLDPQHLHKWRPSCASVRPQLSFITVYLKVLNIMNGRAKSVLHRVTGFTRMNLHKSPTTTYNNFQITFTCKLVEMK